MIRYLNHKNMGKGKSDWLESHFHFSFANYYNPENMQFGVLRVLNDDEVKPFGGFDTHPHKNMEIISYVVEGELSHADSMDNLHTLLPGQVQYMSAGTGVLHSEYNNTNNPLRFLQIWILPDQQDYAPNYGEYRFNWQDRQDKWLPLVSDYQNADSEAPIRIHADANFYAIIISEGNAANFEVKAGRQAYLVAIDGHATVNNITVDTRDALEIIEEPIEIRAIQTTHILLIEMAKS